MTDTTDTTKDPEYPSLKKEIEALAPDSPGDRGAMMLLAECEGARARELRDDPTKREPETLREGYGLAFETPDGIIGLQSSWLRDSFYLGWPSHWGPISGEDFARAFPAIRPGPRWRADYGRLVGDATITLPKSGAETSLEAGHSMWAHQFHVLRGDTVYGNSGPPRVSYGHGVSQAHRWDAKYYLPQQGEMLSEDSGRRLFTEPFWRHESEEARNEWHDVQEAAFLQLACEMANAHGVTSVCVKFATMGVSVIPEVLEVMGFRTHWVRGQKGRREGWGSDVVYGTRESTILPVTEEVMLVSANSLVPWVMYRQIPVVDVSPDTIRSLLTF